MESEGGASETDAASVLKTGDRRTRRQPAVVGPANGVESDWNDVGCDKQWVGEGFNKLQWHG
jgi:hypothetical protein